jgi:hypothetical protein
MLRLIRLENQPASLVIVVGFSLWLIFLRNRTASQRRLIFVSYRLAVDWRFIYIVP